MADAESTFILSGTGDVIEPDEYFHLQLGRSLLLRFAGTPEAQEQVEKAGRRPAQSPDRAETGIPRSGTDAPPAPAPSG